MPGEQARAHPFLRIQIDREVLIFSIDFTLMNHNLHILLISNQDYLAHFADASKCIDDTSKEKTQSHVEAMSSDDTYDVKVVANGVDLNSNNSEGTMNNDTKAGAVEMVSTKKQ